MYIYMHIIQAQVRGALSGKSFTRIRLLDSLCFSTAAAHPDKIREWNVSKQKWKLC